MMLGSDDEDCRSPISCVNSVFDTIEHHCYTPATSSARSPCKQDFNDPEETVLGRLDGNDEEDQPDDPNGLSELFSHETVETEQATTALVSAEPFSKSHQQEQPVVPRGLRLNLRRQAMLGINSPDRFMFARSTTPTKQALLLSRAQADRRIVSPLVKQDTSADPFLPTARGNTRISERYAVLRTPTRLRSPISLLSTIVTSEHHAGHAIRGTTHTSWTVDRQPVTEGVISTPNRRGGRITSGSNAPHFCADLLRLTEKDHGLAAHKGRLAVAMDLDLEARLCCVGEHPYSSNKREIDEHGEDKQSASWKDGRWRWNNILERTTRSNAAKQVSPVPFRVLDAPTLRDDFYCSLLAYCPVLDCLAVGLANHIYLWSEKGRRPDGLPESLVSQNNPHHVTSISFSSSGQARSVLAISRADGLLNLWHPLEQQPRINKRHAVPISFVSFRPCAARRHSVRDSQIMVETEELLVGDDLSKVMLYSVEWPSQEQCDLFNWSGGLFLRAVITCHSQQICGIAWSADGEQFATGANDNHLSVFTYAQVDRFCKAVDSFDINPASALRQTSSLSQCSNLTRGDEKKMFSLNAAVKAIAFAPWQPDLLAAGGGSNDRCVHFFHVRSGARLATINCHAQVTSVVWNTHRREVAVTLGFAQPKHSFRIAVFAWPSCDLLASIPWAGEERALYAIAFPGGPLGRRDARRQTLVVATSDASIKFHEVWPERKVKDKRTLVDAESHILSETCSAGLELEAVIR